MRFGIYLNPQTPGPGDDGRVIREVLGQVDLAEALGYESVWLTDHHFTGYNAFSEPVTLAAAISQRNPSLEIGFAVAILPLRHPISFVTQMHLLDQLTGGKVVIGVGPGNSPDEFAGFGVPVDDRHAMTAEFVEVMRQAWAAPPTGFTYVGDHFNGTVDGRIIPASVQRPHPPIAYASSTPATLERIGRNGWSVLAGPHDPATLARVLHHWMKGMDDAGLDTAARERAWAHVGVNRQFYVAAPGEDWHETIGEAMEVYVRKSAKANVGIDDLDRDDLQRRMDGYLRDWLIAGTAEEIVERVRPYAELGFADMMCWFTFGHIPDALARRSIERFAADVIPALRDVAPSRALLEQVRTGTGIAA
jgi:alkanesulfonate monooxygenase SsuD/methylene tetrahydromethanopterin reductase-like flavin-dependent oxidoreductase (luciferase family)